MSSWRTFVSLLTFGAVNAIVKQKVMIEETVNSIVIM